MNNFRKDADVLPPGCYLGLDCVDLTNISSFAEIK